MGSRTDVQNPIESLEEIAAVLTDAAKKAKDKLIAKEQPVVILTGDFAVATIQGRKGTVIRAHGDLAALNGTIAVPEMSADEALEGAMTKSFGERQTLPADAVERGLYVIECQFQRNGEKGRTPTMSIGKVEKTEDALRTAIEAFENKRAEVVKATTVSKEDDHLAQRRKTDGMARFEEVLRNLRKAVNDSGQPPFTVWHASLGADAVDLFGYNIFGVGGVRPETKVRFIEIPELANDPEKTAISSGVESGTSGILSSIV